MAPTSSGHSDQVLIRQAVPIPRTLLLLAVRFTTMKLRHDLQRRTE